MEVILLERNNLGNVGDLVKVRNGYARNWLIPQAKAILATDENKKEFEAKRAEIEAENVAKKEEAEKLAKKLDGKFLVLIRQAGEDGRLYGSVAARDIAELASELAGQEVKRGQVAQFSPVKSLGVYKVKIALHGEVEVVVNVNVARTKTEADIAQKEFLNPTKKKDEAAEGAVEASEEQAGNKKGKKKAAKVVDIQVEDEAEAGGAEAQAS